MERVQTENDINKCGCLYNINK